MEAAPKIVSAVCVLAALACATLYFWITVAYQAISDCVLSVDCVVSTLHPSTPPPIILYPRHIAPGISYVGLRIALMTIAIALLLVWVVLAVRARA